MSNLFGDHVDEIEGVRVGELLLRQNGLLFDIDWWKSIKPRDKKLNEILLVNDLGWLPFANMEPFSLF